MKKRPATSVGDVRTDGRIADLTSGEMRTWKGWVIFCWEMGFSCLLFDKKPPKEYLQNREWFGWDIEDAVEGIDPNFLKACGIDIPWDVMGDEGQAFYYGDDCHLGMHPPIKISLTLPVALLEQLRLI